MKICTGIKIIEPVKDHSFPLCKQIIKILSGKRRTWRSDLNVTRLRVVKRRTRRGESTKIYGKAEGVMCPHSRTVPVTTVDK